MKKFSILLAAAAMVLAGCEKVDNNVADGNKSDAIYVSFADFNANATKVTADDITAETISFSWESGDKICFYAEGEDEESMELYEYVCTDPETGKFEKAEEDQPDPDPETEYSVVYPSFSEIVIDEETGAMIENYRAGDMTKMHMMCSSAMGYEDHITLIHLPVIHLQLIGDATIGSIKYYSILTGQYAQVSLETIQTCGENGVALDSDKVADFYVSANGSASDGFKIEICDPDGNILESKTSSIDLTDDSAYNTIYDMPVLEIK